MRKTKISPISDSIDISIDSISPDKSISHRSAIFSLLSDKVSRIDNFLFGEDTIHSLKIAVQLGLEIMDSNSNIINDLDSIKYIKTIFLNPPKSIMEPRDILYCGNSGTSIRLYMGLLSSHVGHFILSGDKYLNARPMDRIIRPLNSIGAKISSRSNNTLAPVCIQGSKLTSFSYKSDISSAQVKSAMILSGLRADASSYFSEISQSRDHSERMLISMGADLKIDNNTIEINPLQRPLHPLDINIPSDPSSAFYFALLGAICEGSRVVLKNVLINKTRIEAFNILREMGTTIDIVINDNFYEDVGDIIVVGNKLRAVDINSNISWLIDELPALAIAMACSSGTGKIKNARELRFKESDRIKSIFHGLQAFGVRCEELDDGLIIEGGIYPSSNNIIVNSYGDHRIAMSFAILGVLYGVTVEDSSCIDVSFPNFLDIISEITQLYNFR